MLLLILNNIKVHNFRPTATIPYSTDKFLIQHEKRVRITLFFFLLTMDFFFVEIETWYMKSSDNKNTPYCMLNH